MTIPAFCRRLLQGCLLALLAGLLPGAVSAGQCQPCLQDASQVVSEADYWSLVESSRLSVAALPGKPADTIRQRLDTLATEFKAIKLVTLADGTTVPVDNSYLVSLLSSQKPDLYGIQRTLDTLQTAHRTYPSHVYTTADLQSLKEILARPEFNGLNEQTNPLRDWLQNVWQRFQKWLGDVLQKLFGNRGLNIQGPGWSPLGILSAVVLGLVLAYVIRSLFVDFASEANLDHNGNGAEKALTSDSAFEKAQTMSRGGDYRSAVRYLYLSCLLLLDERGLLRYDHFKTNREVLRSVSGSTELAQPLQDVVEIFDKVWYGYHTLDESSFQHYSQRVEELKEQKK